MEKIYNRKHTKEKRRKLRKNETEAESIVWDKLRNRKFMDFKFRRQYSIGEYIVDFYCAELRIALEIDGAIHLREEAKEYDQLRSKDIEALDIKIIRFTNQEIMEDIEKVLANLKQICLMNKKES